MDRLLFTFVNKGSTHALRGVNSVASVFVIDGNSFSKTEAAIIFLYKFKAILVLDFPFFSQIKINLRLIETIFLRCF